MKQAQEMQAKMAELQESLAAYEADGESGAGLVKAKVSGKGELINLSISPDAMDPTDPTLLEDLVVAAVNDAKAKAEAYSQAEMQKLTGGLSLPDGIKLPF
jgi:DNA-binding YbaB/EbfC family protein